MAPALVERDEGPGDLRAEVAENDFGGGVDAQRGGYEIEERGLGGKALAGEVAVGLELAQTGLGGGRLGVVPTHADPVVEALERELGVLFGFELEHGEPALLGDGEQVEQGAVGGGEGGHLRVDGVGEQVGVELGEVAAKVVFEPALGLEAEEGVSFIGGRAAPLDELGDEVTERGGGFRGERGFGGTGAEGDLLDAVEGLVRCGDADARELEAVQQEGELGGGAEALGDVGPGGCGDELEDACGGLGEAGLGALFVGRVDEMRGEVAGVGGGRAG